MSRNRKQNRFEEVTELKLNLFPSHFLAHPIPLVISLVECSIHLRLLGDVCAVQFLTMDKNN